MIDRAGPFDKARLPRSPVPVGSGNRGRRSGLVSGLILLNACSFTAPALAPSSYDGAYQVTVESTTRTSDIGTECKGGSGGFAVENGVLAGAIVNDWGRLIMLHAKIDAGGMIYDSLASTGGFIATFSGNLRLKIGRGLGQDSINCAGIWDYHKLQSRK